MRSGRFWVKAKNGRLLVGSVSLIEKVQWVIKHEGVPALFEKVWRRVKDPSLMRKPVDYDWRCWVPDSEQLSQMKKQANELEYLPLISIVLPVYNPPAQFLRDAIDSVREQVYSNWELCVADDCSSEPYVKEILQEYADADKRIRVCFRAQNGHISASSNSALQLASGEFVALLDHDDVLAPHALFSVVEELNRDTSLDLIYSDEDKIDIENNHSSPGLKGEWSPDYFLSFMYIGHLSVYRKELIDEVGGFRIGYEGSQDYDLALRVTEKTSRVKHISKMLYYWRMHGDSVAGNIHAKPYAFEAAKKALTDAYKRRGVPEASIVEGDHPGVYRLSTSAVGAEGAAVCLWASSKEQALNFKETVNCSKFSRINIFIGYPVSTISKPKVVSHDAAGEFAVLDDGALRGFQAFLKQCLESCSLENFLVVDLQSCDVGVEVIQELLVHLSREGVGIVGSKLLTPARDVVHAGYTVEDTRLIHTLYGTHRADHGYGARAVALSNVSAVSSICLGVKREVLEGGKLLDYAFESRAAFDLCLAREAAKQSRRILLNPYAKAVLKGDMPARTVDLERFPSDVSFLKEEYQFQPDIDPYYPRGLDRGEMNYQLAKEGYCCDC